jgi:2-phospho-L-lactate/phosphoenolpyruvate guanylyltransferase
MSGRTWAAVIPLKHLAEAKTRLRGALAGSVHERLVLAMAEDTVAAVRACPCVGEVLVVTDDTAAAAALARYGTRVIPDAPAAGLNAAVAYGVEACAGSGRWSVVLTADLPALRPAELAAALRVAGGTAGGAAVPGRSFVVDAAGTGTTLLAAPPGAAPAPRFGSRSAAAHAASGARPLPGDWPSLRRDVDTVADLIEAARLGLGPRTASLLPGGWPDARTLAIRAGSGHDDGASPIAV